MSSAQKRGANLDNKLANELHECTPSHVSAHPMRGSGNTRTPQPDVLIRIGGRDDIALEAKRTSIDEGERTTVLKADDVEQLCACTNDYTRAYVALKLTRRQLVVVKLAWTHDVSDAVQSIVSRLPQCFDANHTRAGNVTIRKPATDEWPSASKGDSDVEVISDAIDVECDVDE